MDKQQTFGNVHVRDLRPVNQDNPECSKVVEKHVATHETRSTCGNKAVLAFHSSNDTETQYRCGIHAKQHHLDTINE